VTENKTTARYKSLPPEQKVGGSNPLGRTISPLESMAESDETRAESDKKNKVGAILGGYRTGKCIGEESQDTPLYVHLQQCKYCLSRVELRRNLLLTVASNKMKND